MIKAIITQKTMNNFIDAHKNECNDVTTVDICTTSEAQQRDNNLQRNVNNSTKRKYSCDGITSTKIKNNNDGKQLIDENIITSSTSTCSSSNTSCDIGGGGDGCGNGNDTTTTTKYADSASIIYIEDDINDDNLSEVKPTISTKIETNNSSDCNDFMNNTVSSTSQTMSSPEHDHITAATSTTSTTTTGVGGNGDGITVKNEFKTNYSDNSNDNNCNKFNDTVNSTNDGATNGNIPLKSCGIDNMQQEQGPFTQTSFSMNKNEEFKFIRPPECPVFRPNEEEFKNPLTYISKVRSVAEKYGICKIIPPKTWTPPFTVNVDKLRFTPRVQRLNELEAKTRIKLNFLDQIAKFWELQGSSLKIPMVERKALDLYTLHRYVQDEGGMEQTTKERKWSKIALRMRYPPGKSVGTILKAHYERILHPFDIFTSGKVVDLKLETEVNDKDYKPHGILSRQQITPPNETTARRSKRFANSTVYSQNGCGFGDHSSSGPPTSPITIKTEIKEEKDEDVKPYIDCRRKFVYAGQNSMGCRSRYRNCNNAAANKKKRKAKDVDPFAKYICHICNRGDAEETMLLCDGCDDSYHTFCLIPPLNDIPKGDWRCPKCVVEEVNKPVEAFGFEQAQREYTLQQFGEMADQFKADYFNMSVHLVPVELVEREFWRIVSSIDEDVTVEYGADLHTMDHGSGFPTKCSLYLLPEDQEYAESSWNLNNLPLLEESILGHINADISGMKVPWMYVGMCFATFCWHNEDHWSYSINYLHWGEPKTWYGVPGSKAEIFEETMKSAAPELFQSQPDLLHQLVTIMNPNILMAAGVPVYRTDQHAGEFVITFPRAYHAGFNQGYNFAEAVNFAPADWMKMGRECINHYSTLRRFCVFSHDELVCKMALDPDKLNLGIATACYLDMVEMVDTEKKLRKSLLDWGVTKADRLSFELIPDDERQCEACKTTCFLSAVACSCTKSIVCLRHNTELCSCPPEKHILKYRYTLDELPLMLKKLKVKAESFENWLSKVRDVLDPNTPTTITLDELQELAQEAETKKFPSSVLLERLNSAVSEAEKCVTVIQQLDINKMRTRTRNSCESAKYKLTLEELDMFVQEIDNLCCIISEGQSVRELQALGKELLESSTNVLSQPISNVDESELERLIAESSSLCIELPQAKMLKIRLQQVIWYNRVREIRDSDERIPFADLQGLLKEGLELTPDTIIEKELYELQTIKTTAEDWEMTAKTCFESGTQRELPDIELLLERANDIECELPSKAMLKDAVKRSKEWLNTVETLQANENYPYFHTLENVVNRGKSIPFELEELKRMEEHLSSAKTWKEQTSRTFLKKHSTLTLMDVLSPRSDAVMNNMKAKKKSYEEQFTEDTGPAQMVIAFKNAEEKELRDMRELRKLNMDKKPADDKFCVCKRKFQGQMYHCQLCKDWFHSACVPPPRGSSLRSRQSTASPNANSPTVNSREKESDIKYLCQSCMRSRRPRLETILSLLVSLQSLPIRLPEGEALQCLTERAMNWQERVRQAFAISDIASALAVLSTVSHSGIENAANNRNDKNNKDNKVSQRKGKASKVTDVEYDNEATTSSDDEGFHDAKARAEKLSSMSLSLPTKIEHAYSVPPFNPSSVSSTKGVLGSPLKDGSYITLSKSSKDLLDDLMMEGDLLEVSLDETSHLWRILNVTKPSATDLEYINYRCSQMNSSNDSLVNTAKKRRSDDSALNVPSKRTSKGTPSQNNTSADTNETNTSASKLRRGRKLKLDSKNNENSTPSDNKRRKRGKKTKDKQSVAVASNSDDDEECSAANCERPSGREVDWVQCDGGCNKWFHMYCVGLDKHQIKPDDDYICKTCNSTMEASNGNRNSRISNNNGGGGGEINDKNSHIKDNDESKSSSNLSSSKKLTLSDDNTMMPSSDVKINSDLSNLSNKKLPDSSESTKKGERNSNNNATATNNQVKLDKKNGSNNSSESSNNNSNFNGNCSKNKNFNSDNNNSTKCN